MVLAGSGAGQLDEPLLGAICVMAHGETAIREKNAVVKAKPIGDVEQVDRVLTTL